MSIGTKHRALPALSCAHSVDFRSTLVGVAPASVCLSRFTHSDRDQEPGVRPTGAAYARLRWGLR